MTLEIKILTIYLILINLSAFLSMGIDKRKAIKNRYRIPEKTLFLLAIFGGSPGSIIGMQLFRHKTRHKSFTIGMPAILIIQLLLAGLLIYLAVFHN